MQASSTHFKGFILVELLLAHATIGLIFITCLRSIDKDVLEILVDVNWVKIEKESSISVKLLVLNQNE